MICFGVESDKEVEQVNIDIVEQINARQIEAKAKRELEGKSVMGIARLCSQPILKEHTPKKKGRKIYVLSSCRKLRSDLINQFKEFCAQCRQCYHLWAQGDYSVVWPPGAFKPPAPPNCNMISF